MAFSAASTETAAVASSSNDDEKNFILMDCQSTVIGRIRLSRERKGGRRQVSEKLTSPTCKHVYAVHATQRIVS